ncbi:MAG TPA: DUF4349 domain-containing protein [Kofleriaceae bacterium]
MRALVLIVLIACGGTKKSAMAPAVPGTSTGRRINSLNAEPAVRHRRQLDTGWRDITVVEDSELAVGTGSGAPPPPATAPAAATTDSAEPAPPPQPADKLVIEAWLDIETENVSAAVAAIHARVEASGGRVMSETVSGSGVTAASASLEVRVPPAQATQVATWLDTLGHVTSKRMLATDVSKTLFDQELALKNLAITMERLQKLAAQSGPVKELLEIEKELTRVRGEIETIKGEQRYLLSRVELATITVQLTRTGDDPIYEEAPEARVYPGPQLAMLMLFDPGMRQRTRFGGGATLRLQRYATFELDVFPRGDNGDSRAVLATFGAGMYSSYLRDGRRRYFNPYIGGRVGYGYLSGDGSPVIAGEVGVELYKHKYVVVDASLRALAFVKTSAEAALHGTVGIEVPF